MAALKSFFSRELHGNASGRIYPMAGINSTSNIGLIHAWSSKSPNFYSATRKPNSGHQLIHEQWLSQNQVLRLAYVIPLSSYQPVRTALVVF